MPQFLILKHYVIILSILFCSKVINLMNTKQFIVNNLSLQYQWYLLVLICSSIKKTDVIITTPVF